MSQRPQSKSSGTRFRFWTASNTLKCQERLKSRMLFKSPPPHRLWNKLLIPWTGRLLEREGNLEKMALVNSDPGVTSVMGSWPNPLLLLHPPLQVAPQIIVPNEGEHLWPLFGVAKDVLISEAKLFPVFFDDLYSSSYAWVNPVTSQENFLCLMLSAWHHLTFEMDNLREAELRVERHLKVLCHCPPLLPTQLPCWLITHLR